MIQATIKSGVKGSVSPAPGTARVGMEETVLKEVSSSARSITAGVGAIKPRRQRPRDLSDVALGVIERRSTRRKARVLLSSPRRRASKEF